MISFEIITFPRLGLVVSEIIKRVGDVPAYLCFQGSEMLGREDFRLMLYCATGSRDSDGVYR